MTSLTDLISQAESLGVRGVSQATLDLIDEICREERDDKV